ncbi:MAG: hypothetical protein Q8K96_17700 [Rubrivivax sp.]|nr:hypothetical protein [Rubrivivax sp.]
MRNHHPLPRTKARCAAAPAWCLAALLAACGGEPAATAAADTAAALQAATPAAAMPAAARAPRADAPANGPEAMPADPSIRTCRGLYLRHAFAEVAAAQLGGDVVWVPVDCCTGDNGELAMLTAYGMQAARNLGNEVPFLVTGTDLRVAALVADRLELDGLKNVYLVTP